MLRSDAELVEVSGVTLDSLRIKANLISCTWKYECQFHNYVQEESYVQDEVKKKTQQF
jgi:hypothetical protein